MEPPRWDEQGCEVCRRAVFYTVPESPFVRIAEAQGAVFLERCTHCGAYWDRNWHDMHVITVDQARIAFPDAILDEPAT